MPRARLLPLAALAVTLVLAGCDQLGLESASQLAARRDAEGKAIGGACRHAARSIEACYEQNRRADKAAVFAGWREMNDYMRENKLEAMPAPDTTEVAAAGAGRDGPRAAADEGRSGPAGERRADAAPDAGTAATPRSAAKPAP